MFWLTVTRSCGHEERVEVSGFDPGKPLLKALEMKEKELMSQPCIACQSIPPPIEKKTILIRGDIILIVAVTLLVVYLLSIVIPAVGNLYDAYTRPALFEKYIKETKK
jgi:hypothetical protein